MQYENLLKSVKEADRNTVKGAIFELDRQQFDEIRRLEQKSLMAGLDLEPMFKNWRTMLKDRTFLEMLMANALIEEE